MKDVFKGLLETQKLIKDREVLRTSYTPKILPHREKQINQLATILATALRGETPSNLFIYGKTGTGKTVVTKYVGKKLLEKSKELGKNTSFVYMNCEIVDTAYGVLSHIGNSIILDWESRIPFTGWPLERVYKKLMEEIERQSRTTIIVLDEVDKLVTKSGDDVLYILSRMNMDLESARSNIMGISNDLKFTEFLDPRVKSSLGEEEIIFPPYNASQLQDILTQRARKAFLEDVLDEEVIPLCSALAAQEHGDARKALDLLRVAAELAEREKAEEITTSHVRRAQSKIESDRVAEVIKSLPTQSKLVLLSILIGEEHTKKSLNTGSVYVIYKELTRGTGLDVLTQRRVTDLLSELDMLGIINARVVSKGRHGRTREIQTSVPISQGKELLREDESICSVVDYKPPTQETLI